MDDLDSTPEDDASPRIHCVGPDQLAELAARTEPDGFSWLHLECPNDELLVDVAAALGWHPLVAEDVRKLGQRPKVEGYDEKLFVVVYGQTGEQGDGQSDLSHDLAEVAVVVSGTWVVTVVQVPVPGLTRLREELEFRTTLSEDAVVYRILDTLVDGALDVAQRMAEDVGRLELEILSGRVERIERLRTVRRRVFEVHSIASAQRSAVSQIPKAMAEVPGLDHSLHHYYRDVLDHATRTQDETIIAREMITHAFDAYLAMLAARQNDVVKRLTVLSTVFLPLMFVTGFFGQNFGWMVRNVNGLSPFIILGVGGCLASLVLTLWWLRRNRLW